MPTPRRTPPRLPESMRRKLDVTTAMAWENLVDTHVAEAIGFISHIGELMTSEESLTRYLHEMDLTQAMATAVRTRVLLGLEEDAARSTDIGTAAEGDVDADSDGDEEALWRRLRPSAMVREVKDRQRRGEALDRLTMLLLARVEERVIETHVENAIGFAALLDSAMPLDRAAQHYLGAVNLSGCRGQVVFQRTMARLADVHLGRA
jgi:hypothetical protein